ncbi:hypothetical protein SE17_39160, partial [Kouleothrix aurantiaca]
SPACMHNRRVWLTDAMISSKGHRPHKGTSDNAIRVGTVRRDGTSIAGVAADVLMKIGVFLNILGVFA